MEHVTSYEILASSIWAVLVAGIILYMLSLANRDRAKSVREIQIAHDMLIRSAKGIKLNPMQNTSILKAFAAACVFSAVHMYLMAMVIIVSIVLSCFLTMYLRKKELWSEEAEL